MSLRDLAEMFLERGFAFPHEAVRDWEARFAPPVADQLRAKRRGQAGRSWYVDETYVNVKGKWCDLYRAIDRDGNLVDSMVSEASSSATTPCVGLEASPQPHVSVAPSMKCVSSFGVRTTMKQQVSPVQQRDLVR